MRRSVRAALVAVLLVCAFGFPGRALGDALEVDGNVYTSPTFGYQIQWSDPWVFMDEVVEAGTDTVTITDGASQVGFSFAFAPGVTAPEILDQVMVPFDETVSNVQPLLDDQGVPVRGGDDVRGWAAITATQQLPDGSTIDFVEYFDARTLSGGVVLVMGAVAASYFYADGFLETWSDLADSALVTEAAGPPLATAEPTTDPDGAATTLPTFKSTAEATTVPVVPSGAGESAPAFASGPWRFAVRAVDSGETVDYLGLGFVAASQWVVVYVDVTNWSGVAADLAISDLTLITANGPVAPDSTGTQSAASILGLEPANGATVSLPAGSATRLALVYSIPFSESELILAMQDEQLPLADAEGRQFDVTDLQTVAVPPAMEPGIFTGFEVDDTGVARVSVEIDGATVSATVAGAEVPWTTGCFELPGILTEALGLAGKTVYLEPDAALGNSDAYYIWIEDAQGNRTLFDQQLIANGVAVEADLPNEARFGAWIEQTEEIARANQTGLWQTCSGVL